MKENKDTAIRSADIDLGYFDLNYASEQDIAQIPGIGTKLARAIIQHRPYRTIEELFDKVPNFTQDTFDELVRAGATVGQGVKDAQEFEQAR
jgi:radical SAM superfamily enzyme with C-terminal helix-hairpin-helix motif